MAAALPTDATTLVSSFSDHQVSPPTTERTSRADSHVDLTGSFPAASVSPVPQPVIPGLPTAPSAAVPSAAVSTSELPVSPLRPGRGEFLHVTPSVTYVPASPTKSPVKETHSVKETRKGDAPTFVDFESDLRQEAPIHGLSIPTPKIAVVKTAATTTAAPTSTSAPPPSSEITQGEKQSEREAKEGTSSGDPNKMDSERDHGRHGLFGISALAPVSVSKSTLFNIGLGVKVSAVITMALSSYIVAWPQIFHLGALSAGQVLAFWFGFFFLAWHVALEAIRFLDRFCGIDFTPYTAGLSDAGRQAVSAAAEFTLYMFMYFICDRTTLFTRTKKEYSKDTFWFLWTLLTIAAFFTLTKAKPPKAKASAAPVPDSRKKQDDGPAVEKAALLDADADKEKTAAASTDAIAAGAATTGTAAAVHAAAHHQENASHSTGSGDAKVAIAESAVSQEVDTENFHVPWLARDQTEEWKGWMQIMFLWYHYFHATDLYNAIRLYIAAYVWMTGFGNFSYYYVRRDFSFDRFCQMQWRLNFMVLWVCLILRNEYMLYYINMLHTTFTVIIYCGLGITHKLSGGSMSNRSVLTAMAVMFACSFVMWDLPSFFTSFWRPYHPVSAIFKTFWAPVESLVGFHNPYKASQDVMYEWYFRSKLDHLVWLAGMLTAFFHPNVDKALRRLDQMPAATGNAIKGSIAAATVAVMSWYVVSLFSMDKFSYNAHHPFTSFIPLTCFIILRNIFATFRRYHLHLFEYCGKITLETYIGQFHIWMTTTGYNGSPRTLLCVLPAKYRLLNFLITSVVLTLVAFRLFHCTNVLKAVVLPSGDPRGLRRNAVLAVVLLPVVYVASIVLQTITGRW